MSDLLVQIPSSNTRSKFLKLRQIVCAGLLLVMSSSGCWSQSTVHAAIFDRLGQKIPDREVNSDRVNWQILSAAKSRQYNGVGLIDLKYGVCTGFFIATSKEPTAPAYVLTNGHCQGRIDRLPNNHEIIINRSSQTNFIVNYFHDFKPERLSIPVKRIVYGTMKNNDIAILELTTTQEQLTRAGITPLTISKRPPRLGEPTIVVGIPAEGVRDELSFLHASICRTGKIVHLKEDIYNWGKSIRHHCSIVGGMSGSPMISIEMNQVVGIINTGVNDSAAKQPACSLNRPCEVDKNGLIQTFDRQNYGQLVNRIPDCFDRDGRFNLYQSTCQLDRP